MIRLRRPQLRCGDLENPQVKAIGGERGRVVGQLRIDSREHSAMDAKFRVAAEAAASAELLINAKAVARGMGSCGCGVFAQAVWRAQFDQAGHADPAQHDGVLDIGRGGHGRNKFRQDHD